MLWLGLDANEWLCDHTFALLLVDSNDKACCKSFLALTYSFFPLYATPRRKKAVQNTEKTKKNKYKLEYLSLHTETFPYSVNHIR